MVHIGTQIHDFIKKTHIYMVKICMLKIFGKKI